MRDRKLVVAGVLALLTAACSGSGGDFATTAGSGRTPAVTAGTAPVTASGTSTGPAAPSPSPAATSASPAGPTSGGAGTDAPSLQSAFQRVQSGVVRFDVAFCGSGAIGSGFEMSPTLVVTAAHVVDGGQVIRVMQGTTATAGDVIGIDAGADVALIRTVAPLAGYRFAFAEGSPQVGDQVAAIGFPQGDPLTFNTGTVNGLGRKAVIEGIARHDLLEMDAATTHGSSGGPVVRPDGAVVGIVDAGPDGEPGRRLAVSAGTAKPLVDGWARDPQPVVPPDCSTAVDQNGDPLPADENPTRVDLQAITTLDVYYRAIDGGDFATAVAQLIDPPDLADFTKGVTSTQDTDVVYRAVSPDGDRLLVWVTFTSHQDPGQGPAARPQETCTQWSLDYAMAKKNGLWLIDATRPHEGTGNAPCPTGDGY
jgi:S1-C subfamily serine protease